MQDTMTRAPDIIDRTMLLDPAVLWPDPLACPDWPALTGTMRYDGPRGRAGAEERLERLGSILNRGSGKLRAPTDEERRELCGKLFRTGAAFWPHLGLGDLAPVDRRAERDAGIVAEAAHICGYLRRIAALEAAAAEAKARNEVERDQRTLDRFNAVVTAGRAELTELAEAEARHRQRVADERAFARCTDIRSNILHGHHGAVVAAGRLGVEAPPLPTFFD